MDQKHLENQREQRKIIGHEGPPTTPPSEVIKKKLSDDAVDGVAAIAIIAIIVGVVVYWLETMT